MRNQEPPLRVLLSDDDEDDRLIFKEILDEMDRNITVNMVNDGKQLMDFLATAPPYYFPGSQYAEDEWYRVREADQKP